MKIRLRMNSLFFQLILPGLKAVSDQYRNLQFSAGFRGLYEKNGG